MPGIRIRVCGLSHPGMVREQNQDRFLVADLGLPGEVEAEGELALTLGSRGLLLAVADGMGGEAAGEVASFMAVDTLLEELLEHWVPGDDTAPARLATLLRGAVERGNRNIHGHAARHPEFRGMGTTLTAAVILGGELHLAQVGDSRAYLVREGEASQLTRDQSLLQHLVDSGRLTPEEAEESPRRNVLLQALGPSATVQVDVSRQPLRRGDVLLLCSDGLSGMVRREEIGQRVTEERPLELVCRELVELANGRGGPDNVTVVVARVDGADIPAPQGDEEVAHRTLDAGGPPGRPGGWRG